MGVVGGALGQSADGAVLLLASAIPTPPAPSYALSLDLSLFTPHFSISAEPSQDIDQDPSYYTHLCRCSGTFVISMEQLEEGMEVVQCDGCSERCRVEYEVLEAAEEVSEELGVGGVG